MSPLWTPWLRSTVDAGSPDRTSSHRAVSPEPARPFTAVPPFPVGRHGLSCRVALRGGARGRRVALPRGAARSEPAASRVGAAQAAVPPFPVGRHGPICRAASDPWAARPGRPRRFIPRWSGAALDRRAVSPREAARPDQPRRSPTRGRRGLDSRAVVLWGEAARPDQPRRSPTRERRGLDSRAVPPSGAARPRPAVWGGLSRCSQGWGGGWRGLGGGTRRGVCKGSANQCGGAVTLEGCSG
jgi:hypothetical protein